MSRNYKYSFADQVLIHAQRPDASACAEYDVWTRRMGRYVRRGAKGIALVDSTGDAPRLRYVFDVSDTGARRNSRPLRLWAVDDRNVGEVQLGLQQDFGAEGEWLSTQLQDAARELAEMYFAEHRHDLGAIVDGSLMAGYDENELRGSFIRAASASAAYALLTPLRLRHGGVLRGRGLRLPQRMEHARGGSGAGRRGQRDKPDRPARDRAHNTKLRKINY